MKNVAVLGSGGMGTAMAVLFAARTESVSLWARKPDDAALYAQERENPRHLPGVPIPDNVWITSDPAEAVAGADLIVVAIPTAFLRATLSWWDGLIPSTVPALSLVKGIEARTFSRPSQIVAEVLGHRPVAVLSGPSHAEEFSRGLPASVVVAGHDLGLCEVVRDRVMSEVFRVYLNSDLEGVELAGALKNILGIAAGICEGLGFGDNAKAALLTRGLVEMARLATARGARPETFWGLAGVGDVLTTCYSRFGRNRAVGVRLGEGASLDSVQAEMTGIAEGVFTTRSVHAQAKEFAVPMPITAEVHAILFEGKDPRAAVSSLMLRDPKYE